MNTPHLIQFIHDYLEALFNVDNKNNNKFNQEIQKLVILYIKNEKNDELRQNVIKHLIKYLNSNKEIMQIKDACTFVLGVSKINSKDNNLINEEEVQNSLNEEFKKQINDMLNVNVNKNNDNNKENENNKKNEEEKKEESDNKKDNNEDDVDDEDFDEVEG